MPDEPGFPGQSSLLSGLFGVLQSAATERLSTADVWSSLRQAAGSWAFTASGQAGTPTSEELQASGARILSEQGIGIQEVNTYRALAGSWRSAAENAQSLSPEQQITAQSIFVPPWATTTSSAVPSEYRVRVEWNITPESGSSFSKWSSYQIAAPLTSVEDLLSQAVTLAKGEKSSALVTDPSLTGVASYEIEQV